MASKPKLEKRTWHYLHQPADYEVYCMRGRKINKNHKVTWSEYAGMIWCYDCNEDMKGFGGIFDGPIPFNATKLLMGRTCFHRYNMVKKVVEGPVMRRGLMHYRIDKGLTKKLVVERTSK